MKKNNLIIAFLFCLALFNYSCTKAKKELEQKEYTQWVETVDNGLSAIKQIDDFEFRVIYKPIDYIIAYEIKTGGLQKDSIENRRTNLKGYQYYTLKIKSSSENELMKAGIHSDVEYYERLEYFVSNMQDDIWLVDGKDTLLCALYHFERNYGLSPYNSMVVAFEDHSKGNLKNNDKIFVYDDKVLGVGKVAIKINGNDIDNSPTLKFN